MCVLVAVVVVSRAQDAGDPYTTDEITQLILRAQEHDVIIVPPGVYVGNLVVDKPVVLDGQGQATIDGGGEGVVVQLSAAGITLRGFTIRNSGSGVDHEPAGILINDGPVIIENNQIVDTLYGIDMRQSPGSIIRNNTIHGKDLELGRRGDGIRLWWSHGCTVESNTIDRHRDMVFWYSEDLTIANNRVSNSRYGLHFMYSHNTELRNNTLTSNSVGIYLMYSNSIRIVHNSIVGNRGSSGYAIGLKDCDDITIKRNDLLANRVGIYLDNSPSSVDSYGVVTANMIAFNEIGLLATPITHDNVFSNNAFVENEEQVTVHGSGQLMKNEFSADGIGNFWSNYSGFDKDNDGIGDFSHEPRSLFRSLLARHPNLRIFLHSPAQQAVELTARAFPELSPAPMFIDASPLTRPPEFEVLSVQEQASRLPMVFIAAGLILGSCIAAWGVAHESALSSLETPTNKRAIV